ncbi:MAG: hypothetical protein RJQ04_03390 [Longimicrobiales bacterium]
MRITLNLDDDLVPTLRALAEARGQPLDAVVSGLLRQTLAPPTASNGPSDFPRFQIPAAAPPLTPEMVATALTGP